jgi:hypothetical protein
MEDIIWQGERGCYDGNIGSESIYASTLGEMFKGWGGLLGFHLVEILERVLGAEMPPQVMEMENKKFKGLRMKINPMNSTLCLRMIIEIMKFLMMQHLQMVLLKPILFNRRWVNR